MKQQLTRYEINQKIKQTLVSHGTDIAFLTFSFSGKAAWFTGCLNKTTGAAMGHEEIENLCKALASLPQIRFLNFELEDWAISSNFSSFTIHKKTIAASAPDRNQEPLVIQSSEIIEDVLEDQ